jgi:hypothetical protein
LSDFDKSFFITSIGLFFQGLIASGLARKYGKRKYKRRAKEAMQEMKQIMRSKGLNVLHKYLLLKADLPACEKRGPEEVKDAFNEAASVAGKPRIHSRCCSGK